MKNRLTIIFTLFAIVSTALAGAGLAYFTTQNEGENVRLEWKTTFETNLANFVVQRKTPDTQFTDLATINPTGSNSVYSFVDQGAYKMTNPIFVYRLKIVDQDGSYTYSGEETASPNISGVKRTWGSIKAMFR